MKKIMNTLAFIFIIGFVGAWECGSYDFKTLLLYAGLTLSVLFLFHFLRITLYITKQIKKSKRHKLKRVKIY